MDRVLCGMHWSLCLVCLDDVISFGASVSEALARLDEVLCRLSDKMALAVADAFFQLIV